MSTKNDKKIDEVLTLFDSVDTALKVAWEKTIEIFDDLTLGEQDALLHVLSTWFEQYEGLSKKFRIALGEGTNPFVS